MSLRGEGDYDRLYILERLFIADHTSTLYSCYVTQPLPMKRHGPGEASNAQPFQMPTLFSKREAVLSYYGTCCHRRPLSCLSCHPAEVT